MRISDWSSDVCSSDLLDPDGGVADRVDRAAERNAAGRIEADGRRRELRDVRDLQRRHLLAHAGERRQWRRTAAALQMQQAEILRTLGRAACRERVCQYV